MQQKEKIFKALDNLHLIRHIGFLAEALLSKIILNVSETQKSICFALLPLNTTKNNFLL